MALVLTKKKTIASPPFDPALSEFAEKIDTVGRLEKEAEKIKARIKAEQEKLKPYVKAMKELQALVDGMDVDADETLDQLGVEYRLEAGAKGTARKVVDMVGVHQLLGDELFYQCATVTLKDLDAYLTQPQRDKVIESSRSSRTISITKRA